MDKQDLTNIDSHDRVRISWRWYVPLSIIFLLIDAAYIFRILIGGLFLVVVWLPLVFPVYMVGTCIHESCHWLAYRWIGIARNRLKLYIGRLSMSGYVKVADKISKREVLVGTAGPLAFSAALIVGGLILLTFDHVILIALSYGMVVSAFACWVDIAWMWVIMRCPDGTKFIDDGRDLYIRRESTIQS